MQATRERVRSSAASPVHANTSARCLRFFIIFSFCGSFFFTHFFASARWEIGSVERLMQCSAACGGTMERNVGTFRNRGRGSRVFAGCAVCAPPFRLSFVNETWMCNRFIGDISADTASITQITCNRCRNEPNETQSHWISTRGLFRFGFCHRR